jgi:hypothetical protein
MTTVLDSFVLELGLDPSKFTRGEQEAMASLRKMSEESQRQGNEVESQSRKTLDLLSVVRRASLGALAGFFGGRETKEVFDHIVDLDAATGRFSRTLGMGVRDVSAWQSAFQQVGGTAQSADSALGALNAEMVHFSQTGHSAMLPVLSRLGISLYDNNGKLKTSGELMLELADIVKGMSPRQAAGFLGMIPGMNSDAINLLIQGRAAVEARLAEGRAITATTRESSAAAREFQAQFSLLERQSMSLARSITTFLLPSLNSLMKQLREQIQAGPTNGQSLWSWLTTLPSFALTKGGAADVVWQGLKGKYGYDYSRFFSDFYAGLGLHSPGAERADYAQGVAKLKRAFAATAPSGLTSNQVNFLSALSYLETSQTGAPNPNSTARGYFQFLRGTAARAKAAGLPDPRVGSYAQQATATMKYIRRFHPAAALAIDRGDYASAIADLRGEWPSLPGGSQPQSASRYATFARELQGGGPRPGNTINVGGVTVYTSASDGAGIARDVDASLQRSLNAGAANYGQQ